MLGAGIVSAAPAAAIVPAVQIVPQDAGLQLRSETAGEQLTIEARWVTRWGRAGARLSAARGDGGLLDGTTRAWWQSDLPALASSLRLGSLPTRPLPLREEPALKGLGVIGRVVPMGIDYGLSVGRLEDPSRAEPAASAWLQRRFGPTDSLALQARRQGSTAELGAVLAAGNTRSGRGRWALLQQAAPDGMQTRMLGEHRLSARRLGLQAQADRVVGACTVAAAQGCQALRTDATLNLLAGWQLQWGRGYRVGADDTLLREGHVGATWLGAGLRFAWTLRQRSDGSGTVFGATLSQPLGR